MTYSACAFSGHRIIPEAHREGLCDLVMRAIAYAYESGCRDFYNGGAVGFDMLCASELLRFRLTHRDVRLHMLLPCVNQADKWSRGQRDMYEYILGCADSVEYISESYYDGCMRERNRRLVDSADMLIAYVARHSGGSAQTLRMAKERGIAVYNLFPTLKNTN